MSSILVKPAGADCNLACDYCFYREKAALYPEAPHPRMSEAVLEALVGQYMRLAGANPVFAWQGGEPALMGLDFYRAAVDLERRLGRPGQVVGNGFQTNAVLLDDEWARFLAEYKFLVGVSLDGPQELHDFHRRAAGGAPSWARVMAGVEALRRGGVEFNVLCMVTRESARQPEKLLRFFRDHGLRYLQFIPLVEPGAEPGAPAAYSITPEEYGEFLCRVFDQWAQDWPPAMSIREFDELLATYAGRPERSCTFAEACGTYCVVENNGDVYACDFMVEPQWRLGNLMEQPLAELVASPLFAEFATRKSNYAEQCRGCEWLALCHGGCQKHRLVLATPAAPAMSGAAAAPGAGIDRPSYFCAAYRRFFRHSRRRLRRMAERLAAEQAAPRRKVVVPAGSVGRNDPCPCGSGRKYKHCCMGK